MLSTKSIDEFKQIYQEEYEEQISDDEATGDGRPGLVAHPASRPTPAQRNSPGKRRFSGLSLAYQAASRPSRGAFLAAARFDKFDSRRSGAYGPHWGRHARQPSGFTET